MDAVNGYILTGALAGLSGGLINLGLWVRTLLHTRILGIPLHKGFGHTISQMLTDLPDHLDTSHVHKIQQDILALFDNFMAERLVQKMPVLSMFIDDKLIAEIRAVFHQEMEVHLPQLLKRNITAEKNIITVTAMVTKAISKGLQKYTWHAIAYLWVGAITGGVIGYAISLL